MLTYRCYSLGQDGKIKSAEVVECPTDAAALEEAERRLATSEYPSIEVWQQARLVGTAVDPKRSPQETMLALRPERASR